MNYFVPNYVEKLKTGNVGIVLQKTTPQIYLQEEYVHLIPRTVIYGSMDLHGSPHLRNGHYGKLEILMLPWQRL